MLKLTTTAANMERIAANIYSTCRHGKNMPDPCVGWTVGCRVCTAVEKDIYV
jgi:hypothetical protein